jgi:hypothetical protein
VRFVGQNHVMPARKADAPTDPDKLVREAAGNYHTADDRFSVRGADGDWFLVDDERTNDFGQELIHGPFDTLKSLRSAIPAARRAEPSPRRARPQRPSKAEKVEPPPRPRSWIEELPKAEATGVRARIRALEAAGIDDAEGVVRRDREGLFPTVASALIERRLGTLVEELPARERARARTLLRRAAAILSAEGTRATEPLPGWSLVELGEQGEPPNRRIVLDE